MAFNNIKSHKKTSFRLLRVKQLSEFDYLGRNKTNKKPREGSFCNIANKKSGI